MFVFLSLFFITSPAMASLEYVGDKACQSCHQKELEQWQGSHHDLAMQEVSEENVLGSFNNTTFKANGFTNTFFKDKKRFMVNTDGPDGKLHDYEISYTFGVYPLQQYMVKFPQGKVQVLDIAWDSRIKEQGGQRWFDLHPDEAIKAGDVLHWTGPNLNWNYMCADCHSTNLKKNYSSINKSYDTKWDAINVSCEACHGPASKHLTWAKNKKSDEPNGLTIHFSNTSDTHWQTNKVTSKPELKDGNKRGTNKAEIEVCAKCHSRRTQLTDDFTPGQNFRDHYLPALLDDPLYYADGKIRDEVYVYGSFQQSKMYEQGVRCSDCHNAHTLKLKAEGGKVCAQCHVPEKYTKSQHHFHKANSTGASCISCHMPPKTYMGVDVRNDHSFRIPRPDVANALNTPDACTNCHQDKESLWAADKIKNWYGKTPEGYQKFGPTLAALEQRNKTALQLTYSLLQDDAPTIAKATAIGHLGSYASRQTLLTAMQMLRSKDADTRRQALRALENFPLQHTLPEIYKKLQDPVKIVRIEAARILSPIPRGNLTKEQKVLLERVTEEYHQSLLFISDRPEAQLALAQLYINLGEFDKAVVAFKETMMLQPQYVPGYINYANYLQNDNEKAAFDILQEGLKQQADASLIHALGLWYIRDQQKLKGIEFIRKAANLEPDNSRYQYVYAVAIGGSNPQKAIDILNKALKKHNGDVTLLSALSSYYTKLNDTENSELVTKEINKILTVLPSK